MEEPPQRSDLHGLHREFTRIRGPGGHVGVIEERKAPVREAFVREERKEVEERK
jgi:hypothetical protein